MFAFGCRWRAEENPRRRRDEMPDADDAMPGAPAGTIWNDDAVPPRRSSAVG